MAEYAACKDEIFPHARVRDRVGTFKFDEDGSRWWIAKTLVGTYMIPSVVSYTEKRSAFS